jgi:TonB family protein
MLFISGALEEAELAKAEKHIAECPLCADAAEGLKMWLKENSLHNDSGPEKGENQDDRLKPDQFRSRIALLNERVKQRLHARKLYGSKEAIRLAGRPVVWMAAAATIILFVAGGYMFWLQKQHNSMLMSQKQLRDREANFIAQMPESLAYPPSNSKAILDIKYNSGKGTNTPPIVTIVNADLALASDRKGLGGYSTDNTADETEYSETREGVESDVFRDEVGTYKGQNDRRALTVKNSGGAMQKTETDEETRAVFISVQQMPSFPGGDVARIKYLAKNLRYPARAAEDDIQGTVYVSFVVKTDGRITNVKLLRGIGGGCDEEALRVVLKMPQWKPGYLNGKKVDVLYHMPVHFKLQ